MKQQIFFTFIFTLILHTSAKLTDNADLSCKLSENPFARRYLPDNNQPTEQQDILISKKFHYDMLNAHNILRKQHCVPPLILDDKISENAQAYAEYLAKQDNPIKNPNADEVTRSWYNEIVNYNFDIPGSVTKTGHFTQIVWKDTKKLGIGIAFAREGRKM